MAKISLIGKDINFLTGLQSRFSVEGFEVEIGKNTPDKTPLIHWLKRKLPDYVIVEMSEPYYESLEIVKRAKREDELHRPLFFIFSLLPQEELRDRSLSCGADFFFLKEELDMDTFLISFKRIIKNRSS